MDGGIKVFGGSAGAHLLAPICAYLGEEPGKLDIRRFSDGEIFVKIMENVRGHDVFIVQSTCPPSDNILELLLLIDAFKRSSADRVTAVVPYYGYARQERKDQPRVAISAKLMANLLTTAGADRLLVLDLHAAAIQGFFDIPVDHLFSRPVALNHLREHIKNDLVLVSPDAGGVERTRAYAKRLHAPLAIIDKRRSAPNEAEVMHLIGEVEGKNALIIDDIVDTAGSLCKAAEALAQEGAGKIYAFITHPVLSGPAVERIHDSRLEALIVTDTIALSEEARNEKKIISLSVAELLGEAIKRIHSSDSVSSLFW